MLNIALVDHNQYMLIEVAIGRPYYTAIQPKTIGVDTFMRGNRDSVGLQSRWNEGLLNESDWKSCVCGVVDYITDGDGSHQTTTVYISIADQK